MARLRRSAPRELWVSRLLREPAHDPAAAARNGAYKGPLPVQHVPAALSGKDLGPEIVPAPGQVWRRGVQRVRVVRLEPAAPPTRRCSTRFPAGWVVFLDLTHRGGQRRMREDLFVRSSSLEEAGS